MGYPNREGKTIPQDLNYKIFTHTKIVIPLPIHIFSKNRHSFFPH